ncbi:MAG: VCBS repeat-containing protein, partial [Candidatus Omnitrophica bacterium]|nr:VCBS repeat-containing protein [Candidatus Omnitrophota bacterium]
DGDGDLDLVVGNRNETNRLYPNNGTTDPWNGVSAIDLPGAGNATLSVGLADFDGDGDLDLVEGNWSSDHENFLYLNNGTSNPWGGVTPLPIGPDKLATYALLPGDVDGDGDLDILSQNWSDDFLYLNNGTSNPFAGATGKRIIIGTRSEGMALGDVDNDGDLDIVEGNGSGGSFPNYLYLNNGTSDPWNEVEPIQVGEEVHDTRHVLLGDVDNDGDLDLIALNFLGPIRLYRNNGTSNPWAGVVGVDISTDQKRASGGALADIDGDGDLDLLTANGTHVKETNRLYLNNGTSEPWSGVSGIDITSDTFSTRWLTVGDVDGDGDLDFVTAESTADDDNPELINHLYLNSGFNPPIPLTLFEQLSEFAINWIAVDYKAQDLIDLLESFREENNSTPTSTPTVTPTVTPIATLEPSATETQTPSTFPTPTSTQPCIIYVSGGTGLQSAIDSAQPGCTVEIIDSATYVEDITLDKEGLTLRAAEGESPSILAANTVGNRPPINAYSGGQVPDYSGMLITADGVKLEGIHVATHYDGSEGLFLGAFSTGMQILAGNIEIRDCTFTMGGQFQERAGDQLAVAIPTSPNVPGSKIHDILFENCTFSDAPQALVITDLGLTLSGESLAGPPSNIEIRNCLFTRLGSGPTGVETGENIFFKDCIFKDLAAEAIRFFDGKSNRVEGCSFINIDDDAIHARYCKESRCRAFIETLPVFVSISDCLFCDCERVIEAHEGEFLLENSVIVSSNTSDQAAIYLRPERSLICSATKNWRIANCDFFLPNTNVAIGNDVASIDPGLETYSLEILNSNIVAASYAVSMNSQNASVPPTLTLKHSNLFVPGGLSGAIENQFNALLVLENNLSINPIYLEPALCSRDGFVPQQPILETSGIDGGPIGWRSAYQVPDYDPQI